MADHKSGTDGAGNNEYTDNTLDPPLEIIIEDCRPPYSENTVDVAPDAAKVTAAKLTGELLANPHVLNAFTEKLGSMVGQRSGYIESLPKVVKRRIKALKKLQAEMFQIEAKFYSDVHDLERKYANLYLPLYDKREKIINAVVEPTDDECEWESDESEEEEEGGLPKAKITEIDETKQTAANGKPEKDEENTTGVPEFWLTIFKNVDVLAALIQDHDEPILKHLLDVRTVLSPSESMGFTLQFVFSENEFFSNAMLTKEYIMQSQPDPDDPLNYEGPEIVKCNGCAIDWKKGKNVTVKVVKQKAKGKKKPPMTKTVKQDSFFNFFSPPEANDDDEDDEENDTESQLMADFEAGQMLNEQIIPRAVLYFTGDALDDDRGDEMEEGEEGDEDGEDYDEGEDPDYDPTKDKKEPAPECKQQ